jgi:predicted RNA-binding Zn-ribbon protein involved in translation (DUF1610 family)
MGSGAAFALMQLKEHKSALASEREKVKELAARIAVLEAAEDSFVCPKCGASIKRCEISLHQAHEQEPPWNTGFEWCGSCPACEAKRCEGEEPPTYGLCEGCGRKVAEGDEKYLGEVMLCPRCHDQRGMP